MRKSLGLLCAVAMMLPVGIIAAAPAGAAGHLTCKKVGGTVTWKPPVPLSTTKKVKSNITIRATFKGCSGTPKVTSAKLAVPVIRGTSKQNCSTYISQPSVITQKKPTTITWNNHRTSKTGPLKLKPAGLATYTASARIAKGQFKGKKLTVTASFAPTNGGCTTKNLKTAKLSIKPGTKVVIK